MFRGYRFDLHPTPAQAETLGQWVGVTRLVYNLALEQRRDFWRQYLAIEGRNISVASQGRELTELRKQFDFIAAAPQASLEAALNDLDKAYTAFFKGTAAYPMPRRLGLNDSVRFRGRGVSIRRLNRKWAEISVAKMAGIRFRITRDIPAAVKTATLRRSGSRWFVTFICDVGEAPGVNDLPSVGIDRGIANTLSLSTGEHINLPSLLKHEKRARKAQKILARRRRGSKRYGAQRARLARHKSATARARGHWAHGVTKGIAARFGAVALEDLQISNMTASAAGTFGAPGRGVSQKSGLNRSILNQAWGQLASLLDYKLEAAGGRLVLVPAAYTSQTCQACGVIDAQSRKSQAIFLCVHCGHRDHADTNAALEIRRRSTALLRMEGDQLGSPREVRTLAA